MSPYEITMPGGSVEHWNEEAGQVWMGRLLDHFPKAVWLNPVPQTALGLHPIHRPDAPALSRTACIR